VTQDAGAGQQRMPGGRADEQAGQRDQQQVRLGGQVRGEQAAEGRSGQAAEAPRGVETRHHRAPQRGDHVDRDAVHGHVEEAVGGAEDGEQEPERDRRPGQGGKRHGGREQDAGGRRHPRAAEPAAQRSGRQHGGHGAG
jgi:hypothetical protein